MPAPWPVIWATLHISNRLMTCQKRVMLPLSGVRSTDQIGEVYLEEGCDISHTSAAGTGVTGLGHSNQSPACIAV